MLGDLWVYLYGNRRSSGTYAQETACTGIVLLLIGPTCPSFSVYFSEGRLVIRSSLDFDVVALWVDFRLPRSPSRLADFCT